MPRRYKDFLGMPEDGHQRGHVLQRKEEIRWLGGLRTVQAKEPGGELSCTKVAISSINLFLLIQW